MKTKLTKLPFKTDGEESYGTPGFMKQVSEIKPHHTPTPWKLANLEGSGLPFVASASGYAVADTGLSSVNAQEAQANAAFIVCACNLHEELVELLKDWDRMIPRMIDHTPAEESLRERTRRLIAKAEGK